MQRNEGRPMTNTQMQELVRAHLAKRLNCSPAAFDGTLDGSMQVTYIANDQMPEPFLEITALNDAIVVSTSPSILEDVRKLLDGRYREEIFELPLIYGQSIYYVPDLQQMKKIEIPERYTVTLYESDTISPATHQPGLPISDLSGLTGFENSLAFDADGNTPTVIALILRDGDEIIGVAGASPEGDKLWEVGIDIRPAYRHQGLAAALVSNLSMEIMDRDVLPFYCAASSNIGSQAVAHRSGYIPYWISTYRTILDGSCGYDALLSPIIDQFK